MRSYITSIPEPSVKAHALTGFFQKDIILHYFRVERSFKYLKICKNVIYTALRNLSLRRWKERALMLDRLGIQNEMEMQQHSNRYPP